ncbi:MAG TPA: SPOR domain-containing protein [Thermoanaerobaculia bacterium]|nr:SPOR domain-containing protein [Thermoanaerobaculia bacterium]
MADEERGGTGDGGPVHDQISITGRQAAAFFLALLVALGLAFFFGMKTGAAARHGDVAAVSASNDPPSPSPKASKEEPPKLGFAPVKPEPVEEPTKVPSKSEPPRPKPTEEPSPQPTATPKAAAVSPTKPPAAEPTRAPKAEPTKAPEKGTPFFVQVLATKSPETADELAKKLKKAGFKADVSEIPNKAGWFRVRVGPYGDKARAQAAAKKIQAAEKSIKKPMVVP